MIISTCHQRWPLKRVFTISRDSRAHTDVVVVHIEHNNVEGVGECVPSQRYGETVESVLAQIYLEASWIENLGADTCPIPGGLAAIREQLLQKMPASAARNALDCALWDLQAKTARSDVAQLAGLAEGGPIISAQTIGMGCAEETGARAREYAGYPLLKVKVGRNSVLETLTLIHTHAPRAQVVIDANEAWDYPFLCEILPALSELPVALIEQPLKAGEDGDLVRLTSPIPLCADESLHTRRDLPRVEQRYDCVNIKLDKAGGLTEGLALAGAAKACGLKVMVGCMVGTSLSMSPAYLLARLADFVDLDGPTLLAEDHPWGFSFDRGVMVPDKDHAWGVE